MPVLSLKETALFYEMTGTLHGGDMVGGARQLVEEVALGPGAWERMPGGAGQTSIANAPTFRDEPHHATALNVDTASLRSWVDLSYLAGA